MRKLIAQEWLSADGFAADENGSTEFFGSSEYNEQSDRDIMVDMDSFDTILLGANTYRLFLDFWPTEKSKEELIAERLNETPKVVFSNSLEKAEWGKWNNAHVQNGDAAEAIKKLKQQRGKDMVLWGSLSLFRSLLDADLIDEIHIRTVPIILGKGITLFGESNHIKLQNKETKKYPSGVSLVEYVVKK